MRARPGERSSPPRSWRRARRARSRLRRVRHRCRSRGASPRRRSHTNSPTTRAALAIESFEWRLTRTVQSSAAGPPLYRYLPAVTLRETGGTTAVTLDSIFFIEPGGGYTVLRSGGCFWGAAGQIDAGGIWSSVSIYPHCLDLDSSANLVGQEVRVTVTFHDAVGGVGQVTVMGANLRRLPRARSDKAPSVAQVTRSSRLSSTPWTRWSRLGSHRVLPGSLKSPERRETCRRRMRATHVRGRRGCFRSHCTCRGRRCGRRRARCIYRSARWTCLQHPLQPLSRALHLPQREWCTASC